MQQIHTPPFLVSSQFFREHRLSAWLLIDVSRFPQTTLLPLGLSFASLQYVGSPLRDLWSPHRCLSQSIRHIETRWWMMGKVLVRWLSFSTTLALGSERINKSAPRVFRVWWYHPNRLWEWNTRSACTTECQRSNAYLVLWGDESSLTQIDYRANPSGPSLNSAGLWARASGHIGKLKACDQKIFAEILGK